MIRKLTSHLVLAALLMAGTVNAHMGEDHDEHMAMQADSIPMTTMPDSQMNLSHHTMKPVAAMGHEATTLGANAGFPTLHPLAVHFPLVLLPTGFLLLALGVAFKNSGVKIAGWGVACAGTLGAWVSSELLHAHATGLSPIVAELFESHEYWAKVTVWISTAGLLIGLVRLVVRKFKGAIWLDLTGAALFLVASFAVAVAGHQGACLTHIHGIGPMGNHLMME